MSDEELMGRYSRCVIDTHIDQDLIEKAQLGEDIISENFKKFLNCFFKSIGFQEQDGAMNYDTVRSMMPQFAHIRGKEDPTKAIEFCESTKPLGATPEETAYLNYKCYMGV